MARFIKSTKCKDVEAMGALISNKNHIDGWEEEALYTTWCSFWWDREPAMQLEICYGPTNNPHEINGCKDFTFQKEWLEAWGFKMVGQHGNWDTPEPKKESK